MRPFFVSSSRSPWFCCCSIIIQHIFWSHGQEIENHYTNYAHAGAPPGFPQNASDQNAKSSGSFVVFEITCLYNLLIFVLQRTSSPPLFDSNKTSILTEYPILSPPTLPLLSCNNCNHATPKVAGNMTTLHRLFRYSGRSLFRETSCEAVALFLLLIDRRESLRA